MKRRTLALGLLTGLAGCSILPERPPLKLYTLLANLNTQDCRAPKRRLSSVRINSPMIASPYDSTRCYVLIKDNRLYKTVDHGMLSFLLIPSVHLLISSRSLFPSSSSMLLRNRLQLSSKWKFLWWQAFPANWFSMKPTAKHRTRQQTICREP